MTAEGEVSAGTPLTAQERRVLLAICATTNTREAAAKLFLTTHTINTYTRRIRTRTGTHTLAAALAAAVGRGEVVIEVELGDELSQRHQQILIGFAKGYETEQIAEELKVSKDTVKNEITELYKTLGVPPPSRLHLVYMGFKTGNLTINRRKQNG